MNLKTFNGNACKGRLHKLYKVLCVRVPWNWPSNNKFQILPTPRPTISDRFRFLEDTITNTHFKFSWPQLTPDQHITASFKPNLSRINKCLDQSQNLWVLRTTLKTPYGTLYFSIDSHITLSSFPWKLLEPAYLRVQYFSLFWSYFSLLIVFVSLNWIVVVIPWKLCVQCCSLVN